jgi:hypothetical protein
MSRFPMCRLCQHEHAGVDHVWKDEPKVEAVAEVKKRRAPNIPNVPNTAPKTAAAKRSAEWKKRNAEKHRGYMRDLMARRRAAGTAS